MSRIKQVLPLRLIHISTGRGWRAAEHTLSLLSREMEEPLYKQVFFLPPQSALRKFVTYAHFSFYLLKGTLLTLLPEALRLIAICKKERIGLIHVHDGRAHTLVYIASRLGLKIPYIIQRRGQGDSKRDIIARYKYADSKLLRIVCSSKRVMELMGPMVQDKSKLCVIYDPVEPEGEKLTKSNALRRELDVPEYYKLVGVLSNFRSVNDLSCWLEAAEVLILANKKIKFLIAGEGPQWSYIYDLIASKGLEDDVILIGPRKDAITFLNSLDAYLTTTESESLSPWVQACFYIGVPVAATKSGATGEWVKHNITGVLAPPRATEQLAIELVRLLEDAKLVKEVTTNARKVAEEYTPDKVAQAYLHLYKTVHPDSNIW